jgi:hypothetical protein
MESSDLIFNREPDKGIYSGGFSIKNYFLNNGISPITTLNQQGGSNNNVSDLFNNLVVPASLYYKGGSVAHNRKRSSSNNDDEDDVVDDNLYNELLKMVSGETKIEKRKSRRAYKKTIRQKSRKSK